VNIAMGGMVRGCGLHGICGVWASMVPETIYHFKVIYWVFGALFSKECDASCAVDIWANCAQLVNRVGWDRQMSVGEIIALAALGLYSAGSWMVSPADECQTK